MSLPTRTLLVLLLALAAVCSDDKSFVVVLVSSSPPIANVAQLRVTVTSGQLSEQLSIRRRRGQRRLSAARRHADHFLVSLRTTFKDDVSLEVQPLDAAGCRWVQGSVVLSGSIWGR